MMRLGRNEYVLGRHVSAEEIEERVDNVTSDQVLEIANELFAPEQLGLCILGPVDEASIEFNRDAA